MPIYRLHQLYSYCERIWFLKAFIVLIRRRIQIVTAADEFQLRVQTMQHFLLLFILILLSWAVILFFTRDFFVVFLFFIVTAYGTHVIHDLLIEKLEHTMLAQLISLFSAIRFRYHQHGMVLEAIQEASDLSLPHAKNHARLISDCLLSRDPEKAVTEFYETVNNRFLQALAGLSLLVYEYGEDSKDEGSFYLRGLANVISEMELEQVRRARLHYLLRSLQIIALLPLVVIKPIEIWASQQFLAMNSFYQSEKGLLCKIFIYAVMIVCFLLLRHFRKFDSDSFRTSYFQTKHWKKMKVVRWVYSFLKRWAPHPESRKAKWLIRQMQFSNAKLTMEWFYGKRLLLALALGGFSALVFKKMFGLQPLFFLSVIIITVIGYFLPLYQLILQRWLSKLSIRQEVEQFESLIVILSSMKRMDAQSILIWMERFSFYFKKPLQKCLLSMASGAQMALEQTKEQVEDHTMQIIFQQLIEANERLDLQIAFDYLRADREFVAEHRKLTFEKLITTKSLLGKFVAFSPTYAVIFGYLLIPMMSVSASEMFHYYDQFKNVM
jgi:hypothetical protein